MAYLLGITVGPIQSNIQKSKKLKDLYNSSRIVSDVMIEIKNYLKALDDKIEIIYPSIISINDNNIDLTNYMICKIYNTNSLENMKKNVFDKFKDDLGRLLLEEIFFMFWAVEPLKSYTETYKKLTKKLRSIKNTYEFGNYKERSIGRKCSICGERIRENNKGKLCSVCNYKRTYKSKWHENNFYKSVYEISIEFWKERNRNEIINLTEKIKDLFKDTEKYYSLDTIANLIKLLEKEDPIKVREEKEINEDLKNHKLKTPVLISRLKDIKSELEKLYLREKNPVERPHYKYCFIQVDVDDLGKWISGKWNIDNSKLIDRQKEISGALCKFAYKLKQIFKESKTNIIYAGGDDFLAVLPVEMLLQTLNIIEENFKEIVQDKLQESNNYKRKITYSVGVTIAGCKDEMALALRESRMTLENVKERFSYREPIKNGVGISYIVNSSKIVNMYLTRGCFHKYVDNLQYWENVKNDVSFTYIDALENEFNKMKFEELEIMEFINIKKMMQLEFKRHLNKNRPETNIENFEQYFKLHTELFKSIIGENIIDEILDFKNIINCYRIYEKLTNFEFSKGGEKNEVTENKTL